ncbi:hypothetical protein [Halegenticoccus soli]|uniref:hypothetical protein n=1 Tax=Halegenticoccus soli TaxID=1985678 RepID=UPI001E351B86|nr:hypothetical protein [Halegenticoccus soli]
MSDESDERDEESGDRIRPDRCRRVPRRRLLAGAAAAASVGFGGCLTTGLRASVDGLSGSNVFEDVSLAESWATTRTTAKVTLTRRATRAVGVRELAVVSSSGSEVWTGSVVAGQTSVSDVVFPVGSPATLTAADYDGAFVDAVTVTVDGRTIP